METTLNREDVRPARSNNFRIKPAQRKDMSVIADFVRSSADWYRPFVDEKDMAEHDVDETWEEKNFKRRDFYLGYARDQAVGTISLQYLGSHAYLGYIYLDVKHVGKGYGQKLMKFAHRTAEESGMDGMTLIAHPEATWAKRAYLKYGFDIIASDKDDVLAWNDGALKPYYEEGFELYLYRFSSGSQKMEQLNERN